MIESNVQLSYLKNKTANIFYVASTVIIEEMALIILLSVTLFEAHNLYQKSRNHSITTTNNKKIIILNPISVYFVDIIYSYIQLLIMQLRDIEGRRKCYKTVVGRLSIPVAVL